MNTYINAKLALIANNLDIIGFVKEASFVDDVIEKIAKEEKKEIPVYEDKTPPSGTLVKEPPVKTIPNVADISNVVNRSDLERTGDMMHSIDADIKNLRSGAGNVDAIAKRNGIADLKDPNQIQNVLFNRKQQYQQHALDLRNQNYKRVKEYNANEKIKLLPNAIPYSGTVISTIMTALNIPPENKDKVKEVMREHGLLEQKYDEDKGKYYDEDIQDKLKDYYHDNGFKNTKELAQKILEKHPDVQVSKIKPGQIVNNESFKESLKNIDFKTINEKVRIKPGTLTGSVNQGIKALAIILNDNIYGGIKITSMNRPGETGSLHGRGLAFDFTIDNGNKHKGYEIANYIRDNVEIPFGIDMEIINEYDEANWNKGSRPTTGKHMHVGFENKNEHDKFVAVLAKLQANS